MLTDMVVRASRHIVAIRCQGYTEAVRRASEMALRTFPGLPLVYVSDQRTSPFVFPPNAEVVPITRELLDELGLFHSRNNVGWTCGDYCYYALLDHDWDYLWLIEPDVFINDEASPLLRSLTNNEADLIGTSIGRRNADWSWHARLRAAASVTTTYQVFFPLTRISRRLATACLEFRRSLTPTLTQDKRLHVPNDESVVATTAIPGHQVYDMSSAYPEVFKHWEWNVRILRERAQAFEGPTIAHPVYSRTEYVQRVVTDLEEGVDPTVTAASLLYSDRQARSAVFEALRQ